MMIYQVCRYAVAIAACSAAVSAYSGEDCEVPDITPFSESPSWTHWYSKSITPSSEVHRTPPGLIPFDRMETLEDRPGIMLEVMVEKIDSTGASHYVTEERWIENPALLVSWVHSSMKQECASFNNFNWQELPELAAYQCNPNLDGRGGNIWFAKDGDLKKYLDTVVEGVPGSGPQGIDRACFSPSVNSSACRDSLLWGVAPLGLPFGFDTPSPSWDPYGQAPAAWWMQFIMVAIVDRADVVRPSYNPAVAEATFKRDTRNGEPVWDEDLGRYRFAELNSPGEEDLYFQQQAAIQDFVGYIGGDCGDPADTLRGPGGFYKWVTQWQNNSWGGEAPYGVFPYSSVGFTLNWQSSPGGATSASSPFYSQSEFLLKGEKFAYVIGTWSGSQYLATKQPGDVDWWDSCAEDLNLDGYVNADDLAILLSKWGTPDPCANFTKINAGVDGGDLGRMLAAWGECSGWPEQLREAGIMPYVAPTP